MAQFPLIGLTTYNVTLDRKPPVQINGVLTHYNNAVMAAGGLPVMLPINTDKQQLASLLDRLDGLVLVGGGDMDPRHYGQAIAHDTVAGIDAARDEMELYLSCEALARDMPILAICRGHQVLNVAMGGTLWQDIESMMPNGQQHSWFGQNRPRNETPHRVTIAADSKLAQLLGTTDAAVNSIHHQGIDKLADGLVATAFAPDGLIEAFELPSRHFVVAVQWHPEAIVADIPAQRGIFSGFVDAARDRMSVV